MMRRVVYVLLVLLATGCGAAHHKPRPKLPSRVISRYRPGLDCRWAGKATDIDDYSFWDCATAHDGKEKKK